MSTQGQVENKPASISVKPEGGSGDQCRFCHSRQFRRSRLHMADIVTLLQLRVPARCLRCGQLQTISFLTARTALPAGSGSGPTHEVVLPQPVAQSQTVRPVVAPVPAWVERAPDSGARASQVADPESRDSVPLDVLLDVMDIRCQYCPGQAFRRSRIRLQDVFLILGMKYSVRCLRCGQRQTVNFMVAASGVPSSYKQARSLRNSETWGEFTASSAPMPPKMPLNTRPLPAVVGQVYTLKDIPVGDEPLLPTPRIPKAAAVATVTESKPEAAPVKRGSDDQSIW